jgi:lysylphosphatidylglycerol synthetase-like protein (DUF2156 family)
MQIAAGFQLPNIEDIAKWVASLLEPLSKTGLGFVKWEAQSRSTGSYIALLLVLALIVVLSLVRRRVKVIIFFVALALAIVLLLANIAFSMLNDNLTEQAQIQFWRDTVWSWAYCFFCASIPSFVVAGAFLVRWPGGSSTGGGGGTSTAPT